MALVLALASGTATANSSIPDDNAAEQVEEERSPIWFGAFVTSSALIVGGLSLYAYSTTAMNDELDLVRVSDFSNPTSTITDDDCGNPNIVDNGGHFRAACKWRDRGSVAFWVTAANIPIALFTGYFAFRSLPKKEKRSVAVIPHVTTESVGAFVDVHW